MARGLWRKSVPVPQLLLVLPFKRAQGPRTRAHLPGVVAGQCRFGGPGGGAPVQGALPATPRLGAARVERERRSGERRSSLKRLFAHLDELMGKNRGRQINIIVSCQAGRRQKVTGFPCDGRKRQHQQGWKELERQGRARVRARDACVLTRVCVHGHGGCCLGRWEFPGPHPPVPPMSLVPSTSSPVPRPVALPATHAEAAGGAALGPAGLGPACGGQRVEKHEPVSRSS